MLFKQIIHDGASFYAMTDDGALLWYQDSNANGSPGWAQNSGSQIGTGWNEYARIFAGSEPGVIYAQKPNGDLHWYRDTLGNGSNNANGTSGWDPKSGRLIGYGWNQFLHVCPGLNGVIYAVKKTGELLWYKHLPQKVYREVHGPATEWAEGSGKQIGQGWHIFSHLVFSNLAVPGIPTFESTAGLYGVKPTGELLYYRDEKQDGSNAANGASGWGPGSGNQIGQGWNVFSMLVGAPGGMLYGVKPTGELVWYQDALRNGSNSANGSTGWTKYSGSQVGVGWYPYPAGIPPTLQFDFDSVTFDDSTPVGGNVHLTLRSDGTFTYWGHLHNSGLIDYNVSLVMLVKDTSDRAYTCTVSGHVSGSTGSGSHDFDWRGDSRDDVIATSWPRLVARNQAWSKVRADSDLATLTNEILATVGVVLAVIALPIFWTDKGNGKTEGTGTAPANPGPTPGTSVQSARI